MPIHVATRADDADKHSSDITGLVYLNGKLYSSANDGKIKVWAEDLTKISEVQAHQTPVFSIAGGQNTIFSASNDGTIKSFEEGTLKPKGVLIQEQETEYWVVKFVDGILYASDDQCNVLLFKDGASLGLVNAAQPVKDLAVYKQILFTVKDTDVAVTELSLGSGKLQYSSQAPVSGRGPLFVLGNKLAFVDREGKDINIYETTEEGHLKPLTKQSQAHGMIINAFSGGKVNGADYLFSGSWDKTVKQWKLTNSLIEEASTNVDFPVTALALGSEGSLYAGGIDGHIVRVDL